MSEQEATAGAPNEAKLVNVEFVSSKIAELQQQLEEKAPGYKTLLREIHTILRKDEELVHILKEEEIGVIMRGLSTMKDVVINKETEKEIKVRMNKGLKNVSASDLGL